MGLSLRKQVRLGKGRTAHLSKSGASVSQKIGKNVTVNSRGRVTIRLGKGISWRF